MKEKIIGMVVCMLVITAVIVSATGTINRKNIFDDESTMKLAPGEFIVKLKKDITFSKLSLKVLNQKHHVYTLEKVFQNAKDIDLDNIYLLHVPVESNILSVVQQYATCPDVAYAEPNGIYHIATPIHDDNSLKHLRIMNSYIIPDDYYFNNQWGLHNIGQTGGIVDCDIDAPEAWEIETGDSGAVIAVIDTGIDYTHPDLSDNIWINEDETPGNGIDDDGNGYIDDIRGWDFFDNDNDPLDGFGHGTLCAGVAGAIGNNSIGISGVCWESSLMPLQVINETGWGYVSDIVDAIEYATDNDADVISMSLGYFTNYSTLWYATKYAYSKGVVLVAAAGNAGADIKLYPAAYENVMAIAGTNHNDSIMDFYLPPPWNYWCTSSYGEWVDVAAPAQNIFTTMPTYHVFLNDYGMPNDYMWFPGGTSLSCPYVSGLAALLLSKNPSLTPDEVKTLICENVDPYNASEYLGTGRINAYKALVALNQPPSANFSWTPQNPSANQPITFDASASHDPDGTITLYEWDWNNDGIYDEAYTSPTAAHTWANPGNYPVTVRVTDDEDTTDTCTKTIEVSGAVNFTIDITGGFGVTAVITNTGTINATNIQWKFTLTDGFILLGKTKSGTIPSLAAESSATAKDSPILGFGKTTIKLDVTCAEGASTTKTATGFVFLFFVLGAQEG